MSVGDTIKQGAQAGAPPENNVLLERIKTVATSRNGIMLIVGFLVLSLAAFPFTREIFKNWISTTSYYQHGPLIPFAILYIFALRYPEWKEKPISPTWVPLVLLPLPLYLIYGIANQRFLFGVGVAYLACLFLMAWAFLGGKWAMRMIPYIAFFSMGLPMWTRVIETTTSSLQIISTRISYEFLNIVGMDPYLESPTVINLPNWVLNVEVACSGMKMTLAMIAMAVFVMLAARLKWWGNLIILAVSMPLAVFMNGVRIGIIGVVGEKFGEENGMLMHDYGSYAVMGVAFYLMYILAKALGWKI